MPDARPTPGPWTVMGQAVWTRAEDAVVDVEVCVLNPFEEWEGQRRADAHLIVAAVNAVHRLAEHLGRNPLEVAEGLDLVAMVEALEFVAAELPSIPLPADNP